MGTDPFLAWRWLCPRHACPLQGEKKVPFSLSFPSSPHPQEAGWCHCIIWWQGMWWGKSLQLALGREKCVQSICTPALGECGQVQTTEMNFLPVFIISSIIWCPYSVRLFMSVIFPALGENTGRPVCNSESELRSAALHTVAGSLPTAGLRSQSRVLQYKYIKRHLGNSFKSISSIYLYILGSRGKNNFLLFPSSPPFDLINPVSAVS